MSDEFDPTTLKIDKGVPRPKGRVVHIWPWAEMEVGDSVAIPYEHGTRARQAVWHFQRRDPQGRRFQSRKTTDGMLRVWRYK